MVLVGGEAPATIQCSTSAGKRPRLALKLFRGERDISGFDRPFTPIHRSSPPVFNLGGFGPPRGLTPASACPWVAHPASRPRRATERPVQTRSRCGSLAGLTSPRTATRWLILQKARRHTQGGCSDCLWAHGFRYCFTPPPGGAFHLSLAVLVRYRSVESS